MSNAISNKTTNILILGSVLALASFWIPSRSTFAAEGYPGPEMVESYVDWDPGDGPVGPDCFMRGVNLNELTGFQGAIINGPCTTARAGDFWSRLVIQRGTQAQIDAQLPIWESLGNDFRGEIIVDEGSHQESSYAISFWKSLVRDENGDPLILPATLLFPSDTTRQMVLFLAPLPPERVGSHTAKLTVIEPRGIFNFGVVSWNVVPH
jgi:hypothetical protein